MTTSKMEVSITHLLLGMLVVMATQIDGAKEKREALELAPDDVLVIPPNTIRPEGPPPPACDGRACGFGGTCEEFCTLRFPVARSKKRAIAEFVSLKKCPTGCTCCVEQIIIQTISPPVECGGSRCGDGGVCKNSKECRFHGEEEIKGECYGKYCRCCKKLIMQSSDCIFNGKIYKSGERIGGVCVDVTCKNGQWVSMGYIDECCQRCDVWDDPHFLSFDGWRFDFHGTCNYSITQKGRTYNPDFGVFSDFYACSGSITCIGGATFRDNPNTVITITGGTFITVNGVGHTVTSIPNQVGSHDVMAWTYNNNGCIRFLGTQRLLVDYCFSTTRWGRQIFLYAHPALVDTLYGLCGHFNYFQPDDLTRRNTFVDNLVYSPVDFGNSWETSDQLNKDCPTQGEVYISDNHCLGEALEPFIEICQELLSSINYNGYFPTQEHLEIRIMACARDLCAFEVAGSSKDDIGELLSSVKGMFQVAVMNDAMTKPEAWHLNNGQCEPCKGTCRGNATCRNRCDSTEEEIQQGGCKGEHCKHGGCNGEHCKCCIKKPTCGGDCGSGGICRSCSCQDDEEKIIGDCNLKDCLCCRKKQECTKECRYKKKTYPCVPPSECKKIIKKGKCSEAGCTCCKKRK